MAQNTDATFHPFPRLPLELRIQVWEVASEDRVLRVKKPWWSNIKYYSSPTPAPAVTRACRESRKHCSYQKAFTVDSYPQYIWTNFDCDIIQMRTYLVDDVANNHAMERDSIRHLRIEIDRDAPGYEMDSFWYQDQPQLREFPKLESCYVLVDNILWHEMTRFIEDSGWGACPVENVRIVDAKTGEWVDKDTSGPYQDYLDTRTGGDFTRGVDDVWLPEEETEEEWEAYHERERWEAIRQLQIPLPRIDLDM